MSSRRRGAEADHCYALCLRGGNNNDLRVKANPGTMSLEAPLYMLATWPPR